MRVTYIGYDLFSPVLRYLTGRPDVTINRVVTSPHPWAEHVRRISGGSGIPLVTARVRQPDMAAFSRDSDLVLCAAYEFRLPIPPGTDCVFINIHPSLLPLGRGPETVQWTLSSEPESAGVTLHLMTDEFDAGPIVRQTPLGSLATSSYERYIHEANQAAIALLETLNGRELQRLTPESQANRPNSYHPIMPEQNRTILPTHTGCDIVRMVRAMGPMGACITIDGTDYTVNQVEFIKAAGGPPSSEYVNYLYGCFPCLDGYCLFARSGLKAAPAG